jgi:hypothetical protein
MELTSGIYANAEPDTEYLVLKCEKKRENVGNRRKIETVKREKENIKVTR